MTVQLFDRQRHGDGRQRLRRRDRHAHLCRRRDHQDHHRRRSWATPVEANETFTVSLSGPSGATIADGSAVGTIVNDDAAPPPLLRATWTFTSR